MNLKKKISIPLILVLGVSIILFFLIIGVVVFQKNIIPQKVLAQAGCTCTLREGAETNDSIATCAADEILITGGCRDVLGLSGLGALAINAPSNNGWRCVATSKTKAFAWCCK